MSEHPSLSQLGWQPFFQQQLTLEEYENYQPARVFSQQRSLLQVVTESAELEIPVPHSMEPATVGDWLLLDQQNRCHRLLERLSVFSRKAAGSKAARQLIAANIDTAFIVTSMNQDFSLNRLERYLTLAHEAGVEPIIVLSKADQAENPEGYVSQAEELGTLLDVVAVNSLDIDSVTRLEPWCQPGKTIAFIGSSGVGKSTLVNTLTGHALQHTQPIRDDDDKGRHTTTGRSLHQTPSGVLLLDTPGMRELQLADVDSGIEDTFSEIVSLSQQCRFSDCQHENEPGCAVRSALEAGELDQRRLLSYQKLMREQIFNSATLAEKRARDKAFGKHVRSVMQSKRTERE